MDGKKSFVIYHDLRQPLQLLTDEQRGKLLLALMDYSEFGQLPSFTDSGLSMAFVCIKQTLDRDAAKWEDVRQKRAEAGRKGGKQTQAKRANARFAEQSRAKQAGSGSGNGSVNDPLLLQENTAENPTAPDAADPTGPRQGGGKELNSAQIEYVTQLFKAGKPVTPEQLEQLETLGNGGEAVGDG